MLIISDALDLGSSSVAFIQQVKAIQQSGFTIDALIYVLTMQITTTGITQDQMKRTIGRGMAVTLIGNFLMAWVLLHAIHYAGAVGAGQAAAVAFFNWLGFVLVILLFTWAAEQRSGKLTALKAANELVGMIVMGIILNTWT